MCKHQARVAAARKAAARELGDAVLATGAGKLPVPQLKAILGAVMAMGEIRRLSRSGLPRPPLARQSRMIVAPQREHRTARKPTTGSRPVPAPDVGRDALGEAAARIAVVLHHPATSRWLKATLSGALGRDPVDVLDDADVLRELLTERTAAVVDLTIEPSAI